MGAPRFTEAELARAIRAAKREGAGEVQIDRGVIRILMDTPPLDLQISEGPDREESEWDAVMGGSS